MSKSRKGLSGLARSSAPDSTAPFEVVVRRLEHVAGDVVPAGAATLQVDEEIVRRAVVVADLEGLAVEADRSFLGRIEEQVGPRARALAAARGLHAEVLREADLLELGYGLGRARGAEIRAVPAAAGSQSGEECRAQGRAQGDAWSSVVDPLGESVHPEL